MLEEFFVHEVTAYPAGGVDAYGRRVLGPPEVVSAWVEEKTQMVRDKNGREVVSAATVTTRLQAMWPLESEVLLPSGRRATVLTVSVLDAGGLDLPEHRVYHLT